MITIEQIQKDSKPHLSGAGRMVRYETPHLIISIVGGRVGLYGDFNETFEMAIIDKKTKDFISETLYPEYSDSMGQIMPYVERETMLRIVNELVKK